MAKGKRSHGEGTYAKLPSGSWRCQIMDGHHPDGRKKMRSFTAPTKAEVQQKVREFLRQKEAGKLLSKTITFSAWADLWYSDHRTQVQESTYSNYKYTLTTLKAWFGERPLAEIRQIEINAFLNGLLEQGCSQSKISKCKAMLVQIFTAAEDNELVMRNPAIHAKVIRREEEQEGKEKDAFSEEEIQTLSKRLPDNLLGNSIMLLLGSGMRVQELLALMREDIAEDGSVVHVSKAIKMVEGKPVLGTTKSRKGKRSIPIPEDYRQYALFLRKYGGRQYIWTSQREDGLYSVGTFRKKYYQLLRTIPEVRLLSPHCCRHTYVTRLQAGGVPMEIIARVVGHSKITTTDGYSHTTICTLADMVSVLNRGA